MRILENKTYQEDISYVASLNLPWEKLANNNILITGANGLIGRCLVDVIMWRNRHCNMNCGVYALSRNGKKAAQIFPYKKEDGFRFITHDVTLPLVMPEIDSIEYILHLASNVHPVLYATDPIGTILTNIVGINNMLKFAVSHDTKKFLFTSSEGIYGENRGDCNKFTEDYSGYINCNTLRAGYPESKRTAEALCQAYISQEHLNISIVRLARIYGPTMDMSDSKACSQFIRNALAGEDIVLKSAGNQLYSYLYVMDAVSGILSVLLCGKCGEAYNVADTASDILLKDLASIVAMAAGTKVVYEDPDAIECAGFSPVTKSLLDSSKLQKLGWTANYTIQDGIGRTLEILRT